ncbi:transcription factor Tfb4 [Panus rudis PR-1116 ss-1]|nr:transcription factor Tfb4 [Panus rudis PR-1116 ss-1]
MDRASHLSVVIDFSPIQWHLSAQPTNSHPLSLSTFIVQLLTFLNAHIACKDENTLAVYGALPGRSVLLYSSKTAAPEDNTDAADPNSYRPFRLLDSTVMNSIVREVETLGNAEHEEPVELVGAITKSLCYINRMNAVAAATTSNSQSTSEDPNVLPDPRILIISVSPDHSSSYIPVMNSIFSAQKLKVTIDVCKIYGPENVFLQQAAHLTGGSYIHLDRPEALLQYLTMSFLSPPAIRQLISVPTQDKVDFRAACFCHKNIVDIGFVCSVCLSIFCQPVPVCSTCRTKFPIKTLQRLNASKPTVPGRTPVGSRTPSTSNGTPRPAPANGNIQTGRNGSSTPAPTR